MDALKAEGAAALASNDVPLALEKYQCALAFANTNAEKGAIESNLSFVELKLSNFTTPRCAARRPRRGSSPARRAYLIDSKNRRGSYRGPPPASPTALTAAVGTPFSRRAASRLVDLTKNTHLLPRVSPISSI